MRWEYADVCDNLDKCWMWLKSKDKDGYGKTFENGRDIRAHRSAYKDWFGKEPKQLLVCHKCDNPSCVNPTHLFTGTVKENVNDSLSKGRQDRRGDRSRNHKLDLISVNAIKYLLKNTYFSQYRIAKMFNVSRSCIAHIAQGNRWTSNIGYKKIAHSLFTNSKQGLYFDPVNYGVVAINSRR